MNEWAPYPAPQPPPRRSGVSTRAVLAAAVAVVLGLAGIATVLVLTSSSASAATVALEPVNAPGANPFLPSVAKQQTPVTPPAGTGGTFPGSTPGLYGGTLNNASCDGPAMVAFLQENPAKAAAWAGVLGISPADIPGYVAGLTPVVLRADTYVTNHGYLDGKATTLISVLQAGTAVFVDEYGLPRVRCYCGNPLTPVDLPEDPVFEGAAWPGFSQTNITIVQQTTVVITEFTLVDVTTDQVFTRNRGPGVEADRPESLPTTTATAPPSPTVTARPTVQPPQVRRSDGQHVLTQKDGSAADCVFSDAPRITGSFSITVQPDGSASGRMAGSGSGTRDITCGDLGARMAWKQDYTVTFTGRVSGGQLSANGTLSNVNSTRLIGCTNAGSPTECPPYQTGPGQFPISFSGTFDTATGRGQGTFVVGKVDKSTTGTWSAG